MPPRQPLRSPKPKKTAPAKAGALPLPAPVAAAGTYPNLAPAILQLQQRRRNASASVAPLLDKWLASLTKLQTEITQFRQLEGLATSLTQAPTATSAKTSGK